MALSPPLNPPSPPKRQSSVLCCVCTIVFTWDFQWRWWLLSSIVLHTDQRLTRGMLCVGPAALCGWQTEPEIQKLQHMRLRRLLHGSAVHSLCQGCQIGSFSAQLVHYDHNPEAQGKILACSDVIRRLSFFFNDHIMPTVCSFYAFSYHLLVNNRLLKLVMFQVYSGSLWVSLKSLKVSFWYSRCEMS